jgi:hypothetical protein
MSMGRGMTALVEQLTSEVNASPELRAMSAMRYGQWPLILMACRLHRLPVPPHFWFLNPSGRGERSAEEPDNNLGQTTPPSAEAAASPS